MEAEPCIPKAEQRILLRSKAYHLTTKTKSFMEGPDGGWAWVVAFSACLINFIIAGLGRMSGILYVAFIDMYGVDRKMASAPFSIRSSTRNLLGPIVGILGQKYGVRLVTITGGIIGTLSAAVCFFADDIKWITIFWGGINGLGTALTMTLPQVVVNQYFKRHRTTASGMAFSGGCVGAFLFPVLLEYLLQAYGVTGTFLIMGGIIMHVIPAAMILRKPPWLKNELNSSDIKKGGSVSVVTHSQNKLFRKAKDSEATAEDDNVCNNSVGNHIHVNNNVEFYKKCIDFPFLRVNKELVYQILTTEVVDDVFQEVNLKNGDADKTFFMVALEEMFQYLEDVLENQDSNRIRLRRVPNGDIDAVTLRPKSQSFTINCSHLEKIHVNHNRLSNPDIKCGDEVKLKKLVILAKLRELDEKKENHIYPFVVDSHNEVDMAKVTMELKKVHMLYEMELDNEYRMVETKQVTDSLERKESIEPKMNTSNTSSKTASNSFLDHIKKAFKLHTNPLFVLICLCRATHFATFVPLITVVVDFGMDKGLLEADGKYIIAALSLGDLVGRLGLGWVTDRKFIALPKYMLIVMCLQGISTASLPLMHMKAMLFPAIILFGVLQGSLFVRHPVLVANYMGNDEQSIANGCINFFSGFIGFGLPYFIGYFRDHLGSYDKMFFITGAISTGVGLIWLFEPYFVKHCEKCTQNEDFENSQV